MTLARDYFFEGRKERGKERKKERELKIFPTRDHHCKTIKRERERETAFGEMNQIANKQVSTALIVEK